MKLLREPIRHYATSIAALGFGYLKIPPGHFFDEDFVAPLITNKEDMWYYRDSVDASIANYLAKRAKTFIFSSKIVMDFPLSKSLEPGNYIAPFAEMIFQFTKPIPETEIGLTGAMPSGRKIEDSVAALVVGWPPESGGGPFYNHVNLINVIGYYTSTSFNRAVLHVDGNGEVDYERAIGGYIPGGKEDKQILVNLAMWCIAYLNSPRVEIKKIAGASVEVNAKRERKGKQKLDEYYILEEKQDRIKYEPTGVTEKRIGGKHSFIYDVKRHPRKLPSGKVIIIPPHKRGLDNDEYRSAVRVVGKEPLGGE